MIVISAIKEKAHGTIHQGSKRARRKDITNHIKNIAFNNSLFLLAHLRIPRSK